MDVEQHLNKWTENPVSYLQRDLLLYAVGIGCDELRFTFEHADQFAAFPTYSFVLPYKGTSQDVVTAPSECQLKGPQIPSLPGTTVLLDGQRYLELLNPLPAGGAQLLLRERLLSCRRVGSGAAVEMESILVDSSGKQYSRMVSASFLVGATGFKDGGTTDPAFAKVAVPDRAPDAVEEMVTSASQARIYRLSGDYNPLHLDPDFAAGGGLNEPILHGLCTLGISARAVLKRYAGNDPAALRAIRVRFAKPVIPGQTLVVEMWQDGKLVLFQTKVKETGIVICTNAYAELRPSSRL